MASTQTTLLVVIAACDWHARRMYITGRSIDPTTAGTLSGALSSKIGHFQLINLKKRHAHGLPVTKKVQKHHRTSKSTR